MEIPHSVVKNRKVVCKMLYVNEIRNNAKIARARLRLAISDGANILADASDPGRMALSTVGVQAVTKIVEDIRGNTKPEDDGIYWYHRCYAPLMPRVIKENMYLRSPEEAEYRKALVWMQENKVEMQIWYAYIEEIRKYQRDQSENYGISAEGQTVDYERWMYDIRGQQNANWIVDLPRSDIYLGLCMLEQVKITESAYKTGIDKYRDKVQQLENIVARFKTSGIESLFANRPQPETNILNSTVGFREVKTKIREEAIALFNQIQNGLTARTWGFEIEVPDCKGVNPPAGIEKGEDGSIKSNNREDCECDCNDCAYHECNCDNCDYGSSDPDHCGDDECEGAADSAEYRTVGGVQRVLHGGMLKLCDDLNKEDAEMNDSAGTHIHVYAQDLTTNQVGQVMATYHWLYLTVFTPIAGRINNGYAKELKVTDIANALRKRNPVLRPEKPMAVNISQLLNGRGTIEFRQQDCNLDGKLISAWAWLVRGLVEVAKRGATFTEFRNAKTLADVLAVYAKYNFTAKSENPGLVIVGSRSDENRWEKVTHKVEIAR